MSRAKDDERLPSTSRPGSRAQRPYYKVRVPEMLLPSLCPVNDVTRVRNIGKPLQSRYGAMMSSATMPSLPASPSPSLPSQPLQPPRFRLPPGTLGIVSQVAIQYAVNPLKDSRMKPSPRYEVPLEASPRQARRRSAEQPLEELPLPGRESIADLTTSVSQVPHKPSLALKRSMHLMDGLQTLRCLGNSGADASSRSPTLSPRSAEEAADPLSPASLVSLQPAAPETTPVSGAARRPKAADEGPTEEDPLLLAVLKDLQDTSQSLLTKKQRIEEAQSMVKRCHGTRHPTNLMTDRVRLVIDRKASLLKQVEDRIAEFKAAQAHGEKTLRNIVDHGAHAPEELQGVHQFVRRLTHRGHPADADRKNFREFSSSFKLPGQHKLLEAFQDIAAEAGAWWAEKAYREAVAGAGHLQIMQLMELSVSVGADPKEPMLLRARDVLLDKLRARISSFAQDCMEKDDLAEKRAKERNQVPPLGMAATNADRIEAEVFEAVRLGMDKEDQCIEEAQNAIKVLRQKDGERKRLHNRNKRLQEDSSK